MSNSNSIKSILLLAANPKGTTSLRLQEEEREIKERLRLSGYGKVPVNSAVAARSRDIQQALLDFKPQIVHFSGHGANQQGLVFEDNIGEVKLIDSDSLAQLFELFSNRIECVVLNACYSVTQAQAIAKHINYVVGMNDAIGDAAAIEFSVGFYSAIGAGEDFEFAYKMGCASIRLAGIQDSLIPDLLKRGFYIYENYQVAIQNEIDFRHGNTEQFLSSLDTKDNTCPECNYNNSISAEYCDACGSELIANPPSLSEGFTVPQPEQDIPKISNLENPTIRINKRKSARPAFDLETWGEISVIGPRASGKTTFLAALAGWHDVGFRKPIKSVESINEDTHRLKRYAEDILKNGERLSPTDWNSSYDNHYLFRIEIKPNFWHNPLCWLLKRNVRFSLSCKDFLGEFINSLKSPFDDNSSYIDSFLDNCAFSFGLLIMIDATDSLRLDKEYSQAFSTLCNELTSRIRRSGAHRKYRVAVVFSKADNNKIWKYRKKLKEFVNINFPCTKNIFQEWAKDGYCEVAYFSCSAFGMKGNPPQPNVIDGFSNGNCGYLADPVVWQPFGLAAPIYWLSTGKIDSRLQ